MALRVVEVDELGDLLRESPALARALEDRQADFPRRVLEWLRRVEEVLERLRQPVVSQVAAARAQVLTVVRGAAPAELHVKGRPTTRKLCEVAAAQAFNRIQQLLHDLLAERVTVFAEAERLARQLVTLAEAKGLLHGIADAQLGQAGLALLQERLAADANLAGAHLHLVSLVGKTDELIFLDRALPAQA